VKGLTEDEALLAVFRSRVKLLNRFVTNVNDYDGKEGRDDSPEPVYGSDGTRSNTREKRVRDALKKEYQKIIQDMLVITQKDVPDALKVVAKQRHEVRITIPIDKYPDYNFKGVLIGPRGMNMKRLEIETGCRIAVRGVGMRKRKDGIEMPGDDLPLHVLLEAWDEVKLKQGIEIIKRVLVPVGPEEHQKQLRELAILNGTFREPSKEHCEACGKEGHTLHRCPNRAAGTWAAANVTCARCGSNTHITRDCPIAGAAPGAHFQKLDSEYEDFMKEITGEDGVSRPKPAMPVPGAGVPPPPRPAHPGLGFKPPPRPMNIPPPGDDRPMMRIGAKSLYHPAPAPARPQYPSARPRPPFGHPHPGHPGHPGLPPQFSPRPQYHPGGRPPNPSWPPAPPAPPSDKPWMNVGGAPPAAPNNPYGNPYQQQQQQQQPANPYNNSADPNAPPGMSNPYTTGAYAQPTSNPYL